MLGGRYYAGPGATRRGRILREKGDASADHIHHWVHFGIQRVQTALDIAGLRQLPLSLLGDTPIDTDLKAIRI